MYKKINGRSIRTFSYFFLFFILSISAYAIENCKGAVFNIDDLPCLILLPVTNTTSCSTITTTIYRNNNTFDTIIMDSYSPVMCNVTFNGTQIGTYTASFSTGDTAKWQVTEGDKLIWLIYGLIAIGLVLVIFAIWKQDVNMAALSGMIFLGTGMYILVNGFSIFNNILTKTMAIVCIGLGAYLIGVFADKQFNF